MIRRRALLALLAASPALVPALVRADDSGPVAVVQALNNGLQAVRKAGRSTPFAQRTAMLLPIIQKCFALQDVLRASIGPRYAAIPSADQATLLQVFTDYTVASYVANFDTDNGERFEVNPTPRAVGSDQVVTTKIITPKGDTTRLDYVTRQLQPGWQIVDVLIDGSISQVAVTRSDFRSLLSGGSADKLIASLRRKTESLAAGSKN